MVTSQPQKTYGDPGVWRTELLSAGFLEQCCTIVAVSPQGEDGHATVVHQLPGGVFRCFDPNYGVIDYSNKDTLGSIFEHLFHRPYFRNEEGLDVDLPVYRRRKTSTEPRDDNPWNRMGFTIFDKQA